MIWRFSRLPCRTGDNKVAAFDPNKLSRLGGENVLSISEVYIGKNIYIYPEAYMLCE